MGDECSLLFSKHTFQVRFEVVSWRNGIFFFLNLQSIFMGSSFYSWLGFEVSPFILAFSLLAGVSFSPWWMRKQLFAFNLSYAQLFMLTWLVLWLDALFVGRSVVWWPPAQSTQPPVPFHFLLLISCCCCWPLTLGKPSFQPIGLP